MHREWAGGKMPKMADDSDVAQARVLLSALNDHIARISELLEKADRQHSPQNVSRSSAERSLRRDLYEAHGHVDRIHQRFPDTLNS